MDNPTITSGYIVLGENTPPRPLTLEEAVAEDDKFAKILERFDAAQETAEERRRRLELEEAEALKRKQKQKRILELQTLIAELRSKLSNLGGRDNGIEARISAAQTELFWLMFEL